MVNEKKLPRYYSTVEFAEIIGSRGELVRRRCKRGTLPAVKIGTQWYIPSSVLSAEGGNGND